MIKNLKKNRTVLFLTLFFLCVFFSCCAFFGSATVVGMLQGLGVLPTWTPSLDVLLESSPIAEANPSSTTEIIPTASSTTQITLSPIPPEEITLIPTTTDIPIILNVNMILNFSIQEVEEILGPPVAKYDIELGEEVADTVGGESRDYDYGKYLIYVDYDKNGIAKFFQVITGLTDYQYRLDDYPVILQRFGFTVTVPPTIDAPARYEWTDYQGYTINIAMNGTKSDSVVWTVQIYVTP